MPSLLPPMLEAVLMARAAMVMTPEEQANLDRMRKFATDEDEEGAMEQHERDVRLLAHWRSTSATEPPASTP